ncbi:MAG: MATE family efflux transporter [Lachnospiraceae bacterium]|nr:MATE family efflux transporter [Lachnospiraceae bacterium]
MAETKRYEIDMCNGSLLGKMLKFYFPLMASSMLQLIFNAADVIVVGRFAGSDALAAVGSTASLINLLTNLFIGLSIGANVMVARYYGAKQDKELSDMVHTSMLTALISGLVLTVIGVLFSGPLLRMMGTTKEALPLAIIYMRIYFAGMAFMMIYNFGAAILRAIGDTKRPMIFLLVAGAINFILNLIFVIPLKMSVAGVALATIISQGISAFLIVRCLVMSDGAYKLTFSSLHINKDKFLRMIQIGLPAGVQGVLFSFSNVIIQSSVNSFDTIAVAGNTTGQNLEGFVYMAMNAFSQTALSFSGQNFGARKYDRIKKVLGLSLACVSVVGIVLGNLAVLFGNPLLSLYTDDPQVVSYGLLRITYICTLYFLCGTMDVASGVLRGMGYSIMPTIVSLTGACIFRIVWIFTVFRNIHTLEVLYVSYPISWFLTTVVHLICFMIVYKRLVSTKKEVYA